MIKSKDRSFYIGASDTAMVVGNWSTESWEKWFRQKLGLNKDSYSNEAMVVGTHLEHKILDYLGVIEKDLQIIIPEYGLRVNYDGTRGGHIYEVKTSKNFKLTKAYWQQAQVEMFAWYARSQAVPALEIVAYTVDEEDYKNFFAPIDPERISLYPVEYDSGWIETEYLPKLLRLHECIEKGIMP